MSIYTKKGDYGTTTLFTGEEVQKSDIRIQLLGAVDELTSFTGWAKSEETDEAVRLFLENIQRELMIVMAHVADNQNKAHLMSNQKVLEIEQAIDSLQALYPRTTQFVLPGENGRSATMDIARTVARRAECLMVEVAEQYFVCENIRKYLNRLSDYFYVLARYTDFRVRIENEVRKAVGMEPTLLAGAGDVSMSKRLDLAVAKALCAKVEQKAGELGLCAVVSIVDGAGNPVLTHVMDGAYLVSYEVAMQKAYTAAALKMSTEALNTLAQPGQMFYGIESLKNEKITIISGGVPLESDGTTIGGLGVSGGTDKQDILLANYGKEVFELVNGESSQ